MADLASLTLPIKDETTGVVTPTKYDIPTGGSVTVDSALSGTSENPVQNKVIKAALDGKGTYSKPSGGIPKSDLASAVQTSLDNADAAIPAPSSPTSGQFLVYNGTAWVAQTVPSASGVSF